MKAMATVELAQLVISPKILSSLVASLWFCPSWPLPQVAKTFSPRCVETPTTDDVALRISRCITDENSPNQQQETSDAGKHANQDDSIKHEQVNKRENGKTWTKQFSISLARILNVNLTGSYQELAPKPLHTLITATAPKDFHEGGHPREDSHILIGCTTLVDQQILGEHPSTVTIEKWSQQNRFPLPFDFFISKRVPIEIVNPPTRGFQPQKVIPEKWRAPWKCRRSSYGPCVSREESSRPFLQRK